MAIKAIPAKVSPAKSDSLMRGSAVAAVAVRVENAMALSTMMVSAP